MTSGGGCDVPDHHVTYRHTIHLIADDTNTGDILEDDGRDEVIRTLHSEPVTARSTPLRVEIDEGPFLTSPEHASTNR
jgi:hypothetical protein